jgi:hypothetical protein
VKQTKERRENYCRQEIKDFHRQTMTDDGDYWLRNKT